MMRLIRLIRVMMCGLLLLCVPAAIVLAVIYFKVEEYVRIAILIIVSLIAVHAVGNLITDGDKWPWERSK